MNSGGWIKLYRKTLTSDFWSLNPVARDIFLWLLLSVDHETGTITTSMNNIAQGVSWDEYGSEKRPNRKTVMSYLDHMTELGMLTRESNSKWTRVSICNWSTYQFGTSEKVTPNGQVIGQVIGQPSYNSVPVEEVQEVQEVQSTEPLGSGSVTEPKGFMGQAAEKWRLFNQPGKPPFSIFGRWKKAGFSDQAILEALDEAFLRGIEGNPTGYITSILKNGRPSETYAQVTARLREKGLIK